LDVSQNNKFFLFEGRVDLADGLGGVGC